jgi:hypothetical protein
MDYIKFTKDFEAFDDWNKINAAQMVDYNLGDVIRFNIDDEWTGQGDDRVNSPSHYTAGKQEVIDIIEDAIKTAPDTTQGMLQAQVLKYMLRLWLKDNPIEDAKKAEWYLKRLISKMS